MKTYTLLLLSCLVFAACNRTSIDDGTKPAPLFPAPKTIEANPDGGYAVHPITGDSIKPIINVNGDTVITGIPIPIKGNVIHADSLAKPKSFKVPPQSQLVRKNAHPNRFKIPENIPTFPVDHSKLKKVKVGEGNPDYVLTNSVGDTVKTGVPIPAKGKIVPTSHPPPTAALLPASKDAAIANIQYLDVDQGMNSSYVESILEDQSGNLWFGTHSGVSKYDGSSFTHFTEKEGLSYFLVKSIVEDKNGNIWFGTAGGGISKYDGSTFTHFTEEDGLSKNWVRCIIEDKNGNIWAVTNRGGVSKYDGTSFTHFTEKEGLSNSNVWAIMEDKSGNLWFGTWGGGVSKYDGSTFTHFTEKDGLSSNMVLSIKEDKNGNLWFGTNGGGVSKYDGVSFTHFTEKEGLSHNIVLPITEDSSGNLWFGTIGGGVSKYDGSSFTHFTKKEGLSNNTVMSITEDNSGNLWFGTWGGGISKHKPSSFAHFTEEEGLGNSSVLSILEDKSGNLWFGTDGGGVTKYDGTLFTNFTEKEGLSNNYVRSILEDKSGNLWFGTREGVSKYNGSSFTHFTEKEGLSDNAVMSILEDKNGELWFGTAVGGISKYDGSAFTHFTEREGLSNNNIRTITDDKSGNLWIGIWGGGISKYDGTSFIHFTEKEGVINNYGWSITEDKNGNLWFGSLGGGAFKYDGASFTHFTEKEGLSDNRVYSILEDKNGNLWMGTEKGLNCLSPLPSSSRSKGVKTPPMVIYSFQKGDGLKGLDFRLNSAFIDSKNRAWWGSGKDIIMLDLNNFKVSQTPPTIRLTQLDINEHFIDYRNRTDSLERNIDFSVVQPFENYPMQLVLPYDQNHLTFHFVGIDWSAPHKLRYSYRMLGLSDKWSNSTTDTQADYRNLPYGTYTFQIRAIGESAEWSEPFEYTFSILPPWWHTWWAYAAYIALFLLSLRIFIKWRIRQLQADKERLERTVKERTAEVVAEKEKSDNLLLNILPEEVAEELKEKGHSEAQLFDHVTVLFTDFEGFTALSEKVTPKELVNDLHEYFSAFDRICEEYGIEKIKTIGDAYMAAGGLPMPNKTHPIDVVKAALKMAEVVEKGKAKKIAAELPFFEIRIGVHTGPVVAGIVGVKKFQYDIWGDTVNTASRMESSGEVGKVNMSENTYELVKDKFICTHRGKIQVKNKGELDMYFVEGTI